MPSSKRGDCEPLIDEKLFYRVQGILNRRVRVIAPPQRSRSDCPLRAFVRCQACDLALTGSWSKGRNGRFAYYHCRGGECRDVNIAKAKLEGVGARPVKEDRHDGDTDVALGLHRGSRRGVRQPISARAAR